MRLYQFNEIHVPLTVGVALVPRMTDASLVVRLQRAIDGFRTATLLKWICKFVSHDIASRILFYLIGV